MDDIAIEAMGLRLADRIYAYRMLHIVFGASPNREELEMLSCAQTVEVFARLRDAANEENLTLKTYDQGKESVVAASDVLGRMEKLADFLRGKVDDADYIDSLSSLYVRLFSVPGESYVYPWESPYLDTDKMIFKESTIDVRRRYAAHGFEAVEYKHFPEDHVSMMLDFMARLSERAFQAFGDEDDEKAAALLGDQADFIDAHLGEWLESFHKELCLKDESGMFSQMAEVLRAFVAVDWAFAASVRFDF